MKDRAALYIVEDAEKRGLLTPDRALLDATSGNTGIAYAMIGAAKGVCVILTMPENVSEERKKILTAYGARIILTDPLEGSDGAILRARELSARFPDNYYYADQYNNEANWCAHYETTAPDLEADGGTCHASRRGDRHLGNDNGNRSETKATQPFNPGCRGGTGR